jgi:hypothetical protein
MNRRTREFLVLVASVLVAAIAASDCGSSASGGSTSRVDQATAATATHANVTPKPPPAASGMPTTSTVGPCGWFSIRQAESVVGAIRFAPHRVDEPSLRVSTCSWMGTREFLTLRVWTAPVSPQMQANLCSAIRPIAGLGTTACWQPTVHEGDVFDETRGWRSPTSGKASNA